MGAGSILKVVSGDQSRNTAVVEGGAAAVAWGVGVGGGGDPQADAFRSHTRGAKPR